MPNLPTRLCAHCGEAFTLSRRNARRFCSKGCGFRWHKHNGAVHDRVKRERESLRLGMPPDEAAKARARCKRRLLEGVPLSDVEGMFGLALTQAVWGAMSAEEKAQHKDEAQSGFEAIEKALGTVQRHPWRRDSSKFFRPWKNSPDWGEALK